MTCFLGLPLGVVFELFWVFFYLQFSYQNDKIMLILFIIFSSFEFGANKFKINIFFTFLSLLLL
jgi:hypothetical protein